MTEEIEDNNNSEKERDDKGRFKPLDRKGQNTPKSSDYTKMNSILAKQLNLSDKLADWQMKYSEVELFDKLQFMIDNTDNSTVDTPKTRLGENKPIAPISPPTERLDIPGKVIRNDAGGIQVSMNIKDLLKKK